MNCPYCNNPVPANVSQCPCCGAPVQQQYAPPPPQQQYAPPQQQYAPPPPQYAQQPYASYPVSDKSRVAYILLGLFLGGLGIHNFYAGRVGCGIAQLLITLILGWIGVGLVITGLWVLIEICTVTTDGNGNRFC